MFLNSRSNINNYQICILTNAGGVGVICSDLVFKNNLKLYKPSKVCRNQLAASLPSSASFKNPIDILGDANGLRYQAALDIIETDNLKKTIILVIITPQKHTPVKQILQALNSKSKLSKNLIVPIFLGEEESLKNSNIFYFSSLEEAVAATKNWILAKEIYLAKLAQKSFKTNPTSLKNSRFSKQDQLALIKIKNQLQALKTERKQADNVLISKLVSFFKLPVLENKSPKSLAKKDLQSFLTNLYLSPNSNYVGKVVKPEILHRTEKGFVQLNLNSKVLAENFLNKVLKDLEKPEDVVFQPQVQGGFEVFLGVVNDEAFGPVLLVGSGGIYAELMKDIYLLPIPFSRQDLEYALKATKLWEVLHGFRGKNYSLPALIKISQQLANMAILLPEIKTIDCNPFAIFASSGSLLDFKIQI